MTGRLRAAALLAVWVLAPGCQLLLDFSGSVASDDAGAVDSGAPDASSLCAPYEPNDTLIEAMAVDSATLTAAICPAADSDFYSFSVDGFQDVTLELTFLGGANDLELELYDVDDGAVLTVSTGTDDNETIAHSEAVGNRLPAGGYAVRVFGRTSAVVNDYDLAVTITAAPTTDAALAD